MQPTILLLPRSSAKIFIAGSPYKRSVADPRDQALKHWDYDPANDPLRDPAFMVSE
jgi:hypothetical protein